MLDRIAYFATTFAEVALSVVGLRLQYEQPAYGVRQALAPPAEIRDYGPRLAAETTAEGPDRRAAAEAAFQRLFRYITGANDGGSLVAMTIPVQQQSAGTMISMTAPVQTATEHGQPVMRFFLPAKFTVSSAPAPTDPLVRIVVLPPITVAALRFSGETSEAVRAARTEDLLRALAPSPWRANGPESLLTYDPPFTLGFLRRSEIVVPVAPR